MTLKKTKEEFEKILEKNYHSEYDNLESLKKLEKLLENASKFSSRKAEFLQFCIMDEMKRIVSVPLRG